MMETEETKVYLEEARLANEIERLLSTELGQYLVGRAQIQMDEAKDAMTRLNPFWPGTKRKLARLQQEYRVGELFVRWLHEALQNGEVAFSQLRALEEDDE